VDYALARAACLAGAEPRPGQFTVADQARRDYLHQTAAFDGDEFSVLRVRSEDARRDLRAWAGEAAPA
jgi:hypothetical protein